jgi:hypothetical protein
VAGAHCQPLGSISAGSNHVILAPVGLRQQRGRLQLRRGQLKQQPDAQHYLLGTLKQQPCGHVPCIDRKALQDWLGLYT